jgi:hypothetical protein
MQLAGIQVLRPTQRRMEQEPDVLVSDVRKMLRGPASGPGP